MTTTEQPAGERRTPPLFAPSQINVKSVVWALGTTLVFGIAVWTIWHAPLALAVTFLSVVLAIALDHPVGWLVRHRWPRGAAIAAVMTVALGVLAAIAIVAIPPLIAQITNLVSHVPDYLHRLQETDSWRRIETRLDLRDPMSRLSSHLPTLIQATANRILHLLGSVLLLVGGAVTIFFVTLFMLIFGPELIQRTIREARRRQRPHYERVLENLYRGLGGYTTGLFFLVVVHAVTVSLFLAIIRVPYFLPLGVLAGFSSLIPIVGATLAGLALTAVAAASGGIWAGVATLVFYIVYQQIEDHLLSPLMFGKTVEVNPLLSLLIFLFFVELFGLAGGLVAIPVLAATQIIVSELLRVRQEWLLRRKPEDAPESVVDIVRERREEGPRPPVH